MFYMTYSSPREIQGVLKLRKNPFYYGLGHYRDVDNNVWDIHAIRGDSKTPYVNARLVSNHPSYYGTGSNDHGYGHHTWEPFLIEVVEDN